MTPITAILADTAHPFFPNTTTPPSANSAPSISPQMTAAPQATVFGMVPVQQIQTALRAMREQIDNLLRLFPNEQTLVQTYQNAEITQPEIQSATGERIVEGVFTGQHMIGSDGTEYPIPPNYASKSKLVEGDLMKVTVTTNGAFIFKQIQLIGRTRISGELVRDPGSKQWSVLASGRTYKILTASVTFHKGKSGDTVTILVPDTGESSWGAVEHIART